MTSSAEAEAMDRRNEVTALNRLLGVELSAIHSYDHILKRLDAEASRELSRLRSVHVDSAEILRQTLRKQGREPVVTGEPWDLLLTIAETSPVLMDDPLALKAIQEGEQRGIDEYEAVLGYCDIDESCRQLLRDRLLPRCREHLTTLGRYLRAI